MHATSTNDEICVKGELTRDVLVNGKFPSMAVNRRQRSDIVNYLSVTLMKQKGYLEKIPS